MSERQMVGELPYHRIQTVGDAGVFLYAQLAKLSCDGERLAEVVLNDPRFWKQPASARKHHVFVGGLAVHTAQVCSTALKMLEDVPGARREETVLACLWHDYAKVREYQPIHCESPYCQYRERDPQLPCFHHLEGTDTPTWQNTDHKLLIGHLTRSFAEFLAVVRTLEVPLSEETIDLIGHLMLAHHGRQDWGSPVTPRCVEAWAIHAADMQSAWFTRTEG